MIGIELIPSAVENAKLNADLNGITNARFLAGRAEDLVKTTIRGLSSDAEIIVVLDPPRAGVRKFSPPFYSHLSVVMVIVILHLING